MYKKRMLTVIMITMFGSMYGMEDDCSTTKTCSQVLDEASGHCEEFGLENHTAGYDSSGCLIESKLATHDDCKVDKFPPVDRIYRLLNQPADVGIDCLSENDLDVSSVIFHDKNFLQENQNFHHEKIEAANNLHEQIAASHAPLIQAIHQCFILGFNRMDQQFMKITDSLEVISEKINKLDRRVDTMETAIRENAYEIECLRGELIAQHDDNLTVIEEKEDIES